MNSRLVNQKTDLKNQLIAQSKTETYKVWQRDQMHKFQNLFNGSYKMRKQVKGSGAKQTSQIDAKR